MIDCEALLDEVKFDDKGLVCAICQDCHSGRVLMCAWMNRESLRLTFETGYAHYWSRSRGKLWKKGEESGHFQLVKEIRLDCDGDAVLLAIEQKGGMACHTGRESCFYRKCQNGEWLVTDDVIKDEKEIYGK